MKKTMKKTKRNRLGNDREAGLATRMAMSVKGMILAQAYVTLRAAGLLSCVLVLNGERRSGFGNSEFLAPVIDLHVTDGYVVFASVR